VLYTYGKGFSRFLDVTLLFYCFGTIIGFLSVIGASIPDVISGFGLTRPLRGYVIGPACVIIFLGSLKSELAALRYVSILAVGSMLFVAVAISAQFFGKGEDPSLDMIDIDWGKLPANMTLVLFTFTCHSNLVSVSDIHISNYYLPLHWFMCIFNQS
jgi:amino acid permease